MAKKRNFIVLFALVVLLLSGCSVRTVSDLYCLPMRSEEYNNLQSVMKEAMAGLEYSAPIRGDHRQTVQRVDLNGDGEEEYLVFTKGNADKPLQILVFAGDGEKYGLMDVIECTGSAFDRVEYIHMDNKAGYELVVGCQVSDQVVRSTAVYSMVGDQMEQLMSTSYSELMVTDLDRNGRKELMVLRPGSNTNGVVALYSMTGSSMERSQEVTMSEPVENIKRMMLGKLQDGRPAVYVASAVTDNSGILTDVFTLVSGQLTNVSLSNESGTSVQTLRNHYVYADDIDNDGILELPSLITMHPTTNSGSSEHQYIIRWYSLNADGTEVTKLHTYHNFVGGWYLELDGRFVERLTVNQKGISYEFSIWNEDYTETVRLMTVFALTGQKREEQAVADNRFVLLRGESTIFAASLDVASAEYAMTKETLINRFHLIFEDWITGEI